LAARWVCAAELVHRHRRYLTQRSRTGLKTGLVFPSEAGTRPVGNDQLNDVWREVQVMAGIDRPVTVHGIRHSFHDLARQQGVPDAVVKGWPAVQAPRWRSVARTSTCTTAGA